jgi:hypothetical protein
MARPVVRPRASLAPSGLRPSPFPESGAAPARVRQRALLPHWCFAFLVAILAGIAGLVGVGSAWATTATGSIAAGATTEPAASTTPFSAYDTAAYVCDDPAWLSSPDTAAPDVRGSPTAPESGSWESPAVARDRAVAAETAGTVDRVGSAVSKASEWLGPDARAITNGAGDKIFLSKDGLRRIRTDINRHRPYPHQSPHAHVEELVNDSWVVTG